MPFIKYVGPIDAVDVPLHQIGNAQRNVHIFVSDDVAADLTAQADWVIAEGDE